MDYVYIFPNTYTEYYASEMVLHVDSDDSYLVAPKTCNRVAGYYHLSDDQNAAPHPNLNGAILVECKTLRHVVVSDIIRYVKNSRLRQQRD